MNDGPSIGRVLTRGLAAIAARPLATLVPALVFGAAPMALATEAADRLPVADDDALGGAVAFLIVSAASAILSTVVQGMLVPPTLSASDRAAPSPFRPRMLARLAALSLLVAALTTIGLGLAVVPGVLLSVVLAVSGSAMVAEGGGPLSAMGRSLDLTRGARWRTFGLFALLTVGQLVYMVLVNLPAGVLLADLDGAYQWWMFLLGGSEDVPGYSWFAMLAQTPVYALWGTALSALYLELREWKDGPEPDRLAEIFR